MAQIFRFAVLSMVVFMRRRTPLALIVVFSFLSCSRSPGGRAEGAEPAANRAPLPEKRNDDAQPPALPPAIVALKPKLQGKTPDEVLAIVTKELGPPTRIIGSGVRAPVWDIAGGTLTVNPPIFIIHELFYWLIDTNNLAGAANVVGSYEMTTVADPANHGTRFWTGNLRLNADGSYRFTPSGQNQAERASRPSSFFFDHPGGTYAIRYPAGVTESSLLEKLSDKSLLATLDFIADAKEGAAVKASMALRVDTQVHQIDFASTDATPLTFQMGKGWVELWK